MNSDISDNWASLESYMQTKSHLKLIQSSLKYEESKFERHIDRE